MEDVYVDLDLGNETQAHHPHNEGWIRLFGTWKRAKEVARTWEIVKSSYGAPFNDFWKHLHTN